MKRRCRFNDEYGINTLSLFRITRFATLDARRSPRDRIPKRERATAD